MVHGSIADHNSVFDGADHFAFVLQRTDFGRAQANIRLRTSLSLQLADGLHISALRLSVV